MAMADDGGDDGGGSDEPVYPDEDGTIHGGVDYPDGYPDPDNYPEPDDPNEPNGGSEPQSNYPSLLGMVANIVAQTLGVTFNSAQQAAAYKNNEQTSSPEYKNSVKQLNTSVDALHEVHQIQQTHVDNLLQKVVATQDQEDYSKLLNQYTQQKEQAQATKNLATRIEYSAGNKDYTNVAAEVQNYSIPDQMDNHTYTPMNSDWQDSTNYRLQASLDKTFGDNSEYHDYGHPAINNYPMQSYIPAIPNTNQSYDNSEFPRFNIGISNDVPMTPIEAKSSTNPITNAKLATTIETGEVMSAGATVTDFMQRLNTIPEIDSNIIKQAFATYQGPTGQQIQTDLQKTLQTGIEKIAQECVDGAKAFKLAAEISAKVAPILTAAYIVQQFIQGFQDKGALDAFIRGGVAFLESRIAIIVFGVLLTTELPILASASFALLASTVIDYLLEQVLNHFKL